MADKRRSAAWRPVDWTGDDSTGRPMIARAAALQALMAGEANAEQQQLALKCIVEDVSGAYELSYSPDSPYDTAFAEGRRFVGMQIAKLQGIQLRTTYGAQPIQTRSKHG